MDLSLISVWTSIVLLGFLILTFYFSDFKSNKRVLTISSIVFLAISFTAVLGIFFMTSLDKIVSFDLGPELQYVFDWTHKYYLSSRLFVGLKIASCAITILLSIWAYIKMKKPKQKISKLISITLIIVGTLTVLYSALLSTQTIEAATITPYMKILSIGVNIGLGLILTGIIIGYLTSQEFIKKNILTSQLISTYGYLEENLKKFGKFDKAVYVSSSLRKDDGNTVLILKNISETNPKTATSTKIITKAYALIPPGNELTQLFEKKLKTNFAKVNMGFLQKNLPNLITEDLEIATNLQIKNPEDSITVNFENSIFSDNRFNQKFSEILKTFGCPLSSAIGCAIAKATGKLVTITEYQTNEQRKSTSVTYKLMEETIKLTYDNLT